MEVSPRIIYVVVMALIGPVVIWWMRRLLMSTEDNRKERLEGIPRFEAVRTSSPFEHPVSHARNQALENITARFAIMRHLLLPFLFFIWLVALVYPFLAKVPANLLSLLVAAITIILGIAARPFVENLISGIVISFSQPIRIGDTILIDGNYGTVEDITMIYTRIKIWDWRRYIVPNSMMLQKEFVNYTIVDTYQWAYVEFWVDYGADLKRVRETAIRVAAENNHFTDHEDPKFWIMEMDKYGVKCWVAAWANTPIDAWQLKNDIRTGLVRELMTEGIKPHLYHHSVGTESAK